MTTAINPHNKILLVENDINTRICLVNILKDNFTVYEADNGETGLQKTLRHLPDLILADIVLPFVNGFELCSRIKNNNKLLHIPIVLLAPKYDELSEITSVRLGADDYVVKPFNPKLLKEKISSLIRSRKMLKENFSHAITIVGSEIKVQPHSERFLEKFINLVEENLQNPDLDVGFIAERMHMSHASLYRRTREINGTSVIEFITQIRINRAFQLLKDKEKTLTQIAYETGFCDLKRFRQSFQKQFNITPKQFRDQLN